MLVQECASGELQRCHARESPIGVEAGHVPSVEENVSWVRGGLLCWLSVTVGIPVFLAGDPIWPVVAEQAVSLPHELDPSSQILI